MKIKKPVLRIMMAASIGLAAGAMLELAAFGVSFPILIINTLLLALTVGLIIELVIYWRSARRRLAQSRRLNLDRLPVNVADFIKLIVKKMRYRRKVRADVAAELAAHFEDVLKDCKTDDERDHRARKLIADFGDVKLLAVLLRRAKKRCRPLWRTIVARTFQAIGLLILFLILYIIWFLAGKPAVTTDYLARINLMVRPAADESLNAAPLYHQAAELYKKCSDDFLHFFADNHHLIVDEKFPLRDKVIADDIKKLFANEAIQNLQKEKASIQKTVERRIGEFLARPYCRTTPGERKFIERWVQEQQDALQPLVVGTRKPHYWLEYGNKQGSTELVTVLFPDLSSLRSLRGPLCWRAQLRADQGQLDQAFDDIESCYRLGRHFKRTGLLIEQLVGMAVQTHATQALRDILARCEIHSDRLAVLQREFEQMTADEDFTVFLDAQKLLVYDEIQRCFTEDRLGGGHIYAPRVMQLGSIWDSMDSAQVDSTRWHDIVIDVISSPDIWPAAANVLFAHPNKRQTMETADRYYHFWAQVIHKTPARIRAERIDLQKKGDEIVKGNILLEMMAPAFAKVGELSHRNKTDVQATLAILSLLRYKADEGSYPQGLRQLIDAGRLKELPMDPYSDKPLVYKRTADGFVLYSLGADFDDDGGLHSNWWGGDTEGGDQLFWPVETAQQKEDRLQRERKAPRRRRSSR